MFKYPQQFSFATARILSHEIFCFFKARHRSQTCASGVERNLHVFTKQRDAIVLEQCYFF